MRKGRYTWRLPSLLALVVCLEFVSGCAFTDRHVNLAPPPTVSLVTPSSAVSQNEKVVSVARPQDLRPDPTTVGNIRNGYGMVTAQVRSNSDVAMWVANSLGQPRPPHRPQSATGVISRKRFVGREV
jgi:hypothetical protein